jgi:hypothetical protein
MSSAVLIGNLFFIAQLREKNYYSDRLGRESISYFKTLLEAIKLCIKNRKVLISVILLVFVIGMISYLDEYDGLIIDDFKLPYIWLSVIFGIRFIFIALGNRFAETLNEILKFRNKAFVLAILAGVFYLMFSVVWNQFALIVFGIYCMIMTVAEMIQTNVIQKEISEEGRATVLSLIDVFRNLVMIIIASVYALLSNVHSLKVCNIMFALFCITSAVLLYLVINIRMRLK